MIGVVAEFHVETLNASQVIVDAGETVSAILKDFATGEWEHMRSEN